MISWFGWSDNLHTDSREWYRVMILGMLYSYRLFK